MAKIGLILYGIFILIFISYLIYMYIIDKKSNNNNNSNSNNNNNTNTNNTNNILNSYILQPKVGKGDAQMDQNGWKSASFECNNYNDYIDMIKLNYGGGLYGFLNSLQFICKYPKKDNTLNISEQFNGDVGVNKDILIEGPISILPHNSGDIVDGLYKYGSNSSLKKAIICPHKYENNKIIQSYLTKVDLKYGNSTNYGGPLIGEIIPYCSYLNINPTPRKELKQTEPLNSKAIFTEPKYKNIESNIINQSFICDSRPDDYIESIKLNNGQKQQLIKSPFNTLYNNSSSSDININYGIIKGMELKCRYPKLDGKPNIKTFLDYNNTNSYLINGPISKLKVYNMPIIYNKDISDNKLYFDSLYRIDKSPINSNINTQKSIGNILSCPDNQVIVGMNIGTYNNKINYIEPVCTSISSIKGGFEYI
jgi:hypothetical protein